MFLRSIFVLFFVCSLQAVFAQQPISHPYNFSGLVLDNTTNLGISGAVVTVNDKVYFTDLHGEFDAHADQAQINITCTYLGYSMVLAPEWEYDKDAMPKRVVIRMMPELQELDNAVVTAQRVKSNMPVAHTDLYGSALVEKNLGRDMPFLMESIPSSVATSDAGNGVGYSGIRIRGSDATRVNITINGVPYNDAESQQTYWVDLPDFASSVDDIQIQRGVGITNNGLSAFGASVNINTNILDDKVGGSVQSSIGSFGLRKLSLAYQSGVMKDHWYLEARASTLHSDGYIDRAFADLGAWFVTGGYRSRNYTSIINVFSGTEHTYQAWGGVPAEVLDTNRTYNPYTYSDQTDNYTQTHYQWHQYFYPSAKSSIRLTLNYTSGAGYYEQLEEDQYLPDYSITLVVVGVDTITNADLITQKWLENDFYGAFLQYERKQSAGWEIKSGATFYRYTGVHHGDVIWSSFASTSGYDHTWYSNDAAKSDASVFVQSTYVNHKFIYLIDLQGRNVGYQFEGYNVDGIPVDQQVQLWSFNPKFGITWNHHARAHAYAYIGMSTKEPNRDDYTESTPLSRPVPEKLIDLELGERISRDHIRAKFNYFMMYYIDQLVLTGEINDVGAYTRTNIPESYRTGLEVEYSINTNIKLWLSGNVAYSLNKIVEYTAYVDNWDDGTQITESYTGSDLAFSPSWISYNKISKLLFDKTTTRGLGFRTFAVWTSKTVGKQYVDNSSSDARSLDPYWLNDISLDMYLRSNKFEELQITFAMLNVFDVAYESNAWTYRYQYEGVTQQMMGYYPQAGRNWMLGLRFAF